MKINKILGIIVFLSLLGNIVLAQYIIAAAKKPASDSASPQDLLSYPYLSRRIFAQAQNDIIINFVALRSKLRQYIDGVPDKVGMYFEYLPSGVSIGVNEKDEYVLASLLKVPLAIAALQAVEDKKLSVSQKFILEDRHINREFGTLWKRGAGTVFTFDEIMRAMLVESDNTAANLLFEAVPDDGVDRVFDSLDIPRDITENAPVVSAKNYSSVLRSLYLSSLLPLRESNKILDLLTQTPFSDKIAAGIPSGVKVSHKIGVYPGKSTNDWIYTDCGIIYPPKRPYILCLMTITTEPKAKTYMKTISSYIYEYVNQANVPSQ